MVMRWLVLFLLMALPVRADSLRLILPDSGPIVGEMIALTIRGEYDGVINRETLSFPDSAAYDWIQLEPDSWRDERVNGVQRRVFERRLALFALRPGSLTIGPLTHRLTKTQGGVWVEAPVTAPAATITVAPYPAPGRPLAARNLKVTDDLSGDPSRIGDNQTIQRRITITAEGTMGHLLPPRPDLREKWLISFTAPEKRETRLTANGPVGYVEWQWSLRPITGEQGTLPPIRFSWFDLAKRELRGAITQPIVFGYGRVGGVPEGAAGLSQGLRLMAVGGLALGLLAGLGLMLPGQALAGRGALLRGWRWLWPNPHRRALRMAAASGDLTRLRQVAALYAGHERALGRSVDPAPLARLDRALFAADAPPVDPAQIAAALLSRRAARRG